MKIKILYDNFSLDAGFKKGTGFSALIGGRVLFDTGEEAKSLLDNASALDVDISEITDIVISHDHWDHTGGLKAILNLRPGIRVFICPGFSQELKKYLNNTSAEVIEAAGFCKLTDNTYTTGELPGTYNGSYIAEQSAVIELDRGLVVLSGCAHSGIVKVVKAAKSKFKKDILLAAGGFHLLALGKEEIESIIRRFRALGVKKVAPTHCTGKLATDMFRQTYQNNCLELSSGKILDIDSL